MNNRLEGRVETVKIIDYLPKYKNYNPEGLATGIVTSQNIGTRVIVRNSDVHLGKEILVRFRSKINDEFYTPLGQFLRTYSINTNKDILNHKSKKENFNLLINNYTSNKSNIFNQKISLSSNEYILFGFWNSNWEINEDLPSLEEISCYYDPGEMGKVNLFLRDSSEFRNRFIIKSDKIQKQYGSLSQIISKIKNNLENGNKHSNLFIFESNKDAYALIKQAKKFNLRCIKMDSLAKYYTYY